MNFNLMTKQRKFLLISSAVGFVSMFLPWVSISMFGYTQSANGMHKEGIVVFLCFVTTGVIAYIEDQKKNLDKTMWTVTLLAGAIALLFTLWYYSQITTQLTGAAFVGFGLYIAAIAAIGILVSAYVFRSPTDNLKEGFDTLRNNIKTKLSSSDDANASHSAKSDLPEDNNSEKENTNSVAR